MPATLMRIMFSDFSVQVVFVKGSFQASLIFYDFLTMSLLRAVAHYAVPVYLWRAARRSCLSLNRPSSCVYEVAFLLL